MSSYLICSVSQKPAEVPVVSARSGLVFEKATIEKYLDINGCCPITGEKLEHSDLIPLKHPKSRPLAQGLETNSVPELIHRLREDWDTVALETNALKQHVFKLRKELSHALYQQDASCRVISRLLKERDEARKMLGEFETERAKTTTSNEAAKAKVETNAFFSQALLEKLQTKSVQLKNERKQLKKMKNAFVDFAGPESISQYSKVVDLKVHNGEGKAVEEDPFSGKHLFSVGFDKHVHAFNIDTKKIDASLTLKHKLTDLAVFTLASGEDKVTTLVVADDHKKLHLLHYNQELKKFHVDFEYEFDDNVHALLVHPIGSLLFGLKKDKSWFVFDLEEKKLVYEKSEKGLHLNSLGLHPDGNLLALGDSHGKLHFVDIFANEEVMAFDTDYKNLNLIKFSENGYYLLVGTIGGKKVSVWDLRPSAQKSVKDFEFEGPVDAALFDRSGRYILISAGGIHLIDASKFALISSFKEGGPAIQQLRFGKYNSRIYGIYHDGSLCVYS